MNSDWECTIGMRLYYLSCPQHFHNHNFNEVNLFKTVDKGISTFFSSLPVCVSISMLPLLSHSLCLSQGEKGFFISTRSLSHLPCLQVLALSFPIRLLESCSRPPSFSLHSPQRQSNKGLRQRKRDSKGNGVVGVVRGWWWWWAGGVHRAGWKQPDSKGDGWRKWERRRGRLRQ